MDSHYRSKHWRLVWCGALFLTAGCSQAVLMEQESAQGGVVTYSYKQDRGGPMGSPYRKQALDQVQAKGAGGQRLVSEGEVRGYTSAGMGTIEGTEDEERGRRWGIRFECKGSELGDKPAESLQRK
ncbi:MAG: hypothetical protein H8K06_08455 [Nitrospira sp.]|nr:hypothetical protein [Nitrospira sp.]